MKEKIVVLDYGSQYAHLIAEKIRLLGYYTEIIPPNIDFLKLDGVKGIIVTVSSVYRYKDFFPEFNIDILKLDIPILGICYGHFSISKYYEGEIGKLKNKEYGPVPMFKKLGVKSPLFEGLNFPEQVWMDHFYGVTKLPNNFEVIGHTKDCPYAAIQNLSEKRFGLQFHVEVKDTIHGDIILQNFVNFCGMEKNWTTEDVLNHVLTSIKNKAKNKNVLICISGGLNSTVAFALLNKALGQERVLGLHIDNGFFRKNESKHIEELYKNLGFTNFITEDASETFLEAVKGVMDSQEKSKIIEKTFIKVRNQVAEKLNLDGSQWLIYQGNLYPDIIELNNNKNSHTVKPHHNKVEGIQVLVSKGMVMEPLKDLYQNEVRLLGKELELPEELIMAHPFPSTGIAMNVFSTNEVLSSEEERNLNKAQSKLESLDMSQFFKTSQFKLGVLPVKAVKIPGYSKIYKFPAILKLNTKKTVDWKILEKIYPYITRSIFDVNRVLLSIYETENCNLQERYCDKERLDQTREVDIIVLEELKASGWYSKIYQHQTINIAYSTKKDHCSIILRTTASKDVIETIFAHLDYEVLDRIVTRIKKLGFVDCLYYDITNKQNSDFSWE